MEELKKIIQQVNVFVFDFDGVLIESANAEKKIITEVLKKHGCDFGSEDFIEFSGFPWSQLFLSLSERFDWSKEEAKNIMDECLDISFATSFPVPEGLGKKIEQLSLSGYKIGILTNRPLYSLLAAAEKSKLDLYFFNFIGTLDNLEHCKPSPLVWNDLMEQGKISSEENILFFGDTISDFKATEHENLPISFFGINEKEEFKETNLKDSCIFQNTMSAINFVFEQKKIIC